MYDENIDYEFLGSHHVRVEQLQPWQFRLTHPDIEGRFMWYPKNGPLVYEPVVGTPRNVGEFTDSEQVYEAMMEKSV